jgi:hypothetical protein
MAVRRFLGPFRFWNGRASGLPLPPPYRHFCQHTDDFRTTHSTGLGRKSFPAKCRPGRREGQPGGPDSASAVGDSQAGAVPATKPNFRGEGKSLEKNPRMLNVGMVRLAIL